MEIKVLTNVLKANDNIALDNKNDFTANQVFAINIMSSPGSGKTTLLENTITLFKPDLRIGVIEGDIHTTFDAERIQKHNIPVVQINTAGGCHLDANLIRNALKNLDLSEIDLLFIENVGNLVCPAEYQLGEHKRVVLLSIAEGDDKPIKYPAVFRNADVLVITKTDLLPYSDFNLERARQDATQINPAIEIFEVSCKTGRGLTAWCDWLRQQVKF
jgi:hydrogenase nickel incorporation protein HypB